MSVLAACDIGGTFTDLASWDSRAGLLRIRKVRTAEKLADGVLEAIERADVVGELIDHFRHGSTLAVNTVLERTGADVVLVTTAGFRDVLAMGRGSRPWPFALLAPAHPILVPRERRVEAVERIRADGTASRVPDRKELARLTAEVQRLNPQAVAVCLLHSYVNPEHERLVADALRAHLPEVPVIASHEVSLDAREFERTSTTVVHSYVGPRTRGYLRLLESRLLDAGMRGPLLVMQSNGGLMRPSDAEQRPALTMESGPAAGVMGAAAFSATLDIDECIALDMGGTTAKASLIEGGSPAYLSTYYVGGYEHGLPLLAPVIDIHEVGAGGGSIAWLDEASALHVGPRGAGSQPGPACYALGGTRPTVTDANLALGRLWSGDPMGGAVKLDPDAAVEAIIREVAKPLSMSVQRAASGIIQIAETVMAQAVRRVTIERGKDPRRYNLIAFGGAGPMHASAIARLLHAQRVVIPPAPGVFSALGMLHMPLRTDRTRSVLLSLDDEGLVHARRLIDELLVELGAIAEDAPGSGITSGASLQLRYRGQDHPIEIDLGGDVLDSTEVNRRFTAAYDSRYRYAIRDRPVEIVQLRAWRQVAQPTPPWAGVVPVEPPPAHLGNEHEIYITGQGWRHSRVWWRPSLVESDVVDGPALVVEPTATTVLLPGDRARLGAFGEIQIEVGHG